MKKRNANMELLRVCAMLMIIVFHIFCNCAYRQLMEYGWYSRPFFYKRFALFALISPMGQIGNTIFILISGYFMTSKGKNINLTQISKKLLLQLGFATVILGIISIVAYNKIAMDSSIKLISFLSFNSSSWFVGYYFAVIVFAKIFLNDFLQRLTQQNYIMFLLTLFACTQFLWSRSVIGGLAGGLDTAAIGVFLYALGGYIKKYNSFEKIRGGVLIILIIAMNLLVYGNYYISTVNNILYFNLEGGNVFSQDIPLYGNTDIIPVVLGIIIFELFRRINMSNSRIINFLGSATFMVYLLHDNEFVRSIWNTQKWIDLLYNDIWLFTKKYVLWTCGTFLAGVLFYIGYVFIGKLGKLCKHLVLKQTQESYANGEQ